MHHDTLKHFKREDRQNIYLIPSSKAFKMPYQLSQITLKLDTSNINDLDVYALIISSISSHLSSTSYKGKTLLRGCHKPDFAEGVSKGVHFCRKDL